MNKLCFAILASSITLTACGGGGGGAGGGNPTPTPMPSCSSSISGAVWNDSNADGLRNGGESFRSGVTIELRDDDNNLVQSTMTANAEYNFGMLCADTYTLQFENTAGFIFSPQDAGDDSIDSDVDSNGAGNPIVLDGSNTASNFGAGYIELTPTPTDNDGDGVPNDSDAFPNDPSEQVDSDGDGVGDNADVFPNDPSEQGDSDGDGVGDNADAFPFDNSETQDSDNDGTGDNADAFPFDNSETSDSDNDGVGDNADAFPNDGSETQDSDGDGVGDNSDAFPFDSNESQDSDNDGVGDNADPSPNVIPQGMVPTAVSAVYTIGDSYSRDRPLFGWGSPYSRKIAQVLGVSDNNEARSGWTTGDLLNGMGGVFPMNELYGTPRVADPNGLHIVYAGYNDVHYRPNPFQFDVVMSAENVRSILLEIANAGGRYVVVPLVYDNGRQIAADTNGIKPQLRMRSMDYNAAVVNVVNDVIAATDMTVLVYDFFPVVEDIFANPASYGITNLTSDCQDTQANCAGFFWWDEVHVADDVHQIIADDILQILLDAT